MIVGSTHEGNSAGSDDHWVFSISVDHEGEVKLTQYQAIDHDAPGATHDYDDQLAVLGDHLVGLTGTATIMDGDGDTATASKTIDLGGNIRFADDGPTVHSSSNETGYDIHKIEGDTTTTAIGIHCDDEPNHNNSDSEVVSHNQAGWAANKSANIDFDDGKITMVNNGSSDSEGTLLSAPVFNVAAHNQATISFDVDVKESHGEDTFTWSLYKLHGSDWDKVTSGDTHADQDVTYSWTQGDDSGTYRLVFEADDKSSGGDKFKVEIDDIKVTTTTPDTYDIHGIQVDGNLLTDSHPDGSFGADGGYVKSIAANDTNHSDTAADASDDLTVTGEFGGTLKVDSSDGDYIYTPPTNPPANNATEIFTFTLIDGDGDMASAELSILIDAPDNDPGHGGC
jgi:major membrane immunogen (membrane-anchored lipoprotein)